MSTNKGNSTLANMSNTENLCIVCYRNISIYSIGECDHPVCFECSTRMRVLCSNNECPICRKDISKVCLILFNLTLELPEVLLII